MFKKIPEMIDTSINTMKGEAKYYGTEIEDSQGRFDDSYSTNEGYYLIHKNPMHHIYLVH